MFKIDDAFLADLGLATLPQAEKEAMKHHIYETLEMRVGMKLAQQMSNEQLDEFEAFINRDDQDGALKWLETNFPNYKQVVADELETLRQEVKSTAPQILAASAQNAANPQPQAPVQPSAPQPQVSPTPQYSPMPSQQPTPPSPQPMPSQDPQGTPQYPPQQPYPPQPPGPQPQQTPQYPPQPFPPQQQPPAPQPQQQVQPPFPPAPSV